MRPIHTEYVELCEDCPFHGVSEEVAESFCRFLSRPLGVMGGLYDGPPPDDCPLRKHVIQVELKDD